MDIKTSGFVLAPKFSHKVPVQQASNHKGHAYILGQPPKKNSYFATTLKDLKETLRKIFFTSTSSQRFSDRTSLLVRSVGTADKANIAKDELKNQIKATDWNQVVREVYTSLSSLNEIQEKKEKDIAFVAKTLIKEIPKKLVEYEKNTTKAEAERKVDEYVRKYIRECLMFLDKGMLEKEAKTKAANIARVFTNGLTIKDVKEYNERIRERTLKKRDEEAFLNIWLFLKNKKINNVITLWKSILF